jgi:hypothetical protein
MIEVELENHPENRILGNAIKTRINKSEDVALPG